MQRTGQTFPFSRLISTLFLLVVYSCANESNQSSGPRERTVETESSNVQPKQETQTTEEENTDSNQYENPLDNRESASTKQARLEREAQTCLDEDKIREVEVIVTGEVLDAIDITTQYTSGSIFEDATSVAKKIEKEIDPDNLPETAPAPPNEESTTEEGVKVTLYKRPDPFSQLPAVIPSPIFKFSLTGASTDTGIKVDLDEAIYPLLNGFAKKVKIPYEGNLGISDLAKVIISKKKNVFQISTPFPTTPGEDPIIKIEEVHLRQILKITLRVNGKKIYEEDDVNHVFSFQSGANEKLSYKPEWADLNLSENRVLKQYLESFNECTAPLAN